MTDAFRHARLLANEAETRQLAMDLAMAVQPNDVVTLEGDLGAGKSTLARALIRAIAEDDMLEVPSPTFAIVQPYDLARLPVVHADLYRLTSPDEIAEIGWDEVSDRALLIVEWPDRLDGALSGDRLEIVLTLAPGRGPNARNAVLVGHGTWGPRLERLVALRGFLDNAGWGGSLRRHLQGDASSRSYERLLDGQRRAVLMNAPKKPDGPVVKNGLPYSRIAHLAEDMVPFVAMAEGLRDIGLSTPEIEAVDLDQGFLVIEDLGREGVIRDGAPIAERYMAAVDVLALIHSRPRPSQLATPKGPYTLPAYDRDALTIEVELLLNWYLPMKGARIPASEKYVFLQRWTELFEEVERAPQTWVLRDFHSPNLIWLEGREGVERVGLIDFQDAVMGPAAYDVASLLQDARITVPEELELQLLSRYAAARRAADPSFDMAAFARLYAIMGAQRATKILGIFARLDKRDGKPQYLAHLPRIWAYLQRCLAHPALERVKRWVDDRVTAP
ncbi:tRNA (adenosine(37)-N6)-threonylcarbamoyltransferase complex ATPase subunit type 1 TsaE [Phreatobacter oligotrophus]|uniref:tRNA (adenosine(37)-N6)-threonylcarbamoyltransferase complex ATPase subunit type 1 TsaE n=1 Tax=Phreatobacter oligotrophus TaxID=1122261 RepID=UPI002356E1AF|nr:tRNA (adenosine(37)-N6)-threonylcarbamoyltransferase complex ATPase subunit type 1 TsaE [Phreatobacter oligotrophus]MBX9991957.1 tRNA (adenosine(37)-N6)-threonylcarbamoyltransferase complex ATPase subunit type 1 TsaE [Phreatobacter oligotrophus]